MFNVLQNDTDDLACHLVKHDLNKKLKKNILKKITYKEIRKVKVGYGNIIIKFRIENSVTFAIKIILRAM